VTVGGASLSVFAVSTRTDTEMDEKIQINHAGREMANIQSLLLRL
jgi:hypothetical protein